MSIRLILDYSFYLALGLGTSLSVTRFQKYEEEFEESHWIFWGWGMAPSDLSPPSCHLAPVLFQPRRVQCDELGADVHGVSDQAQLRAPLRGQDVRGGQAVPQENIPLPECVSRVRPGRCHMVSSQAPGLVSELQIPPVFVNTGDHQHDQGRGQVSPHQADEETNPHVQHHNSDASSAAN